jgi:hypothetical protein
MSRDLAEIVNPLVSNGLFENAESAVKNLMADYVLRQIGKHRATIRKFEKKYGMKYAQFDAYLSERAKKLTPEPAVQKKFMLEEEEAFEWEIATEMLESWLGLKGKEEK